MLNLICKIVITNFKHIAILDKYKKDVMCYMLADKISRNYSSIHYMNSIVRKPYNNQISLCLI